MKQKRTNADCAFLKNILVIDKIDFLSNVPNQVISYNKGDVIQLHDKQSIGFLLRGIAILTRIHQNGDAHPSKFISKYHTIDYPYIDGNEDLFELEVCQDCEICWFDRTKFFDYVNNNTKFYKELFYCEVLERHFIDRFNEATSRQLAIDKVYNVMQWFSHVYASKSFKIPANRSKLGAMIGLSRDRVAESLRTLEQEQKLVVRNTYEVEIID